jgi:hypothetical protein
MKPRFRRASGSGRGDAGNPGPHGALLAGGVRSAEAEQRPVRQPVRQDSGPDQIPPGMRRVTDEESAPRSHLCRAMTSRRGLGRPYSSIVLDPVRRKAGSRSFLVPGRRLGVEGRPTPRAWGAVLGWSLCAWEGESAAGWFETLSRTGGISLHDP